MNKRLEIFHEFIYYVFDSLLIPLIRANFHVTESNVHRYRLFFFRHDVWREFSEPAMASLKAAMFEEVKNDKAHNILASRSLGFSQIRLLPKSAGVRPIMNLRRRTLKKGSRNTLGYSINSTLAPVYNMLTYEKVLLSTHYKLKNTDYDLEHQSPASWLNHVLSRRHVPTPQSLQIPTPDPKCGILLCKS